MYGKPKYRVVACNDFELNNAHQEGYELVKVFYEEFEKEVIDEELSPVLNNGYNYNNNNQEVITKKIKRKVIEKQVKALVMLTKQAEVLYGNPNNNQG